MVPVITVASVAAVVNQNSGVVLATMVAKLILKPTVSETATRKNEIDSLKVIGGIVVGVNFNR